MTEYYNRNEVNGRHAVFFTKPNFIEGLTYFDFDTETWRPVEPLDNLPYGLCTYKFLDNDPNVVLTCPDQLVIVTCHDSYRLSTDPDHERSISEMWEEKEWRDLIAVSGAELDYKTAGDGGYEAKVCWPKSDIIPGVITGGPRRFPNINGFGYIYKESRKFSKSGTEFPLLSSEELEKVKEEDRISEQRYKENKERISKLKKSLKYYVVSDPENPNRALNVSFYDTVSHYKTLSKYPHAVTFDLVKEYLKGSDNEPVVNTYTGHQLCFIALCCIAQEYDLCYYKMEKDIKNDILESKENFIVLDKGDVYFDIKVHNATYAYLECRSDPYYNTRFDMEKVEEKTWTFTDITIDNPLFKSSLGSALCIYTDGTKVEWASGVYNCSTLTDMATLSKGWRMNRIQGKILLNGDVWAPSMAVTEDNIKLRDEEVNIYS